MYMEWVANNKRFLIQLWKSFQGYDDFYWGIDGIDTFDPNIFYWNITRYRHRHIKSFVDQEVLTNPMKLRLKDDLSYHLQVMKKKYRFMFVDNFDVQLLQEQMKIFEETPDIERKYLPFLTK